MGRKHNKREPIKDNDTPAVKLDKTPVKVLPKISFDIFSRICGIKWDQLAGLAYYARKQGIKVLTVPEWEDLHEEYKTKPVK